MKTLLENLVALIYLPINSLYPEVIPAKDIPGLEINLDEGTWLDTSHTRHPLKQPPKKIGEYNYFMKDCERGVIGVYDRTNDNHLTLIARNWHELQGDKHRNWNDVD